MLENLFRKFSWIFSRVRCVCVINTFFWRMAIKIYVWYRNFNQHPRQYPAVPKHIFCFPALNSACLPSKTDYMANKWSFFHCWYPKRWNQIEHPRNPILGSCSVRMWVFYPKIMTTRDKDRDLTHIHTRLPCPLYLRGSCTAYVSQEQQITKCCHRVSMDNHTMAPSMTDSSRLEREDWMA